MGKLSHNLDSEEPKHKRILRLKMLVKKLRKEPIKAGSHADAPRTTRYRDLNFLVDIGVAYRMKGHRWAWIEYSPLKEEIVKTIQDYRATFHKDPEMNQVATLTGRPPRDSKFERAFWAAAKKTRWKIPRKIQLQIEDYMKGKTP